MAENPETPIDSLLHSLTVVPEVRWYHLADPSSSALDELAAHFGIHPLQIEDCRHRRQTARLEEHERYTFVVIKVLAGRRANNHPAAGANAQAADAGDPAAIPDRRSSGVPRLHFEDFDIFLGPDYILTVDEGDCVLVEALKPRIAAESSLQKPDSIAHALIDAAVDQYLPALDHLGDFINQLEDRVIRRPAPATLREIFRLKRGLLEFRRVATGMREAVNGLVRRYDSVASPTRQGDRELRIYYRDVYDHVVRVIDFVETYRDLLTGSLDIYLSAVANRTNEVMKVLTIWGTIALPLLILTSFYGMNIKLPLQEHPDIMEIVIAGMGVSALVIFYYFRRKHWF
ncbi:MAG: magnesium transporter CorA family protein [Acidobacteriia bacterium]|nr:magnesium transporter CorA family protein [Terriglobia bacterium]